jgi:[ribosomal protein S18]-alanine N-acetyltransferase
LRAVSQTPAERAALHARCFGHAPRPWSEEEFAEMLDQAGVFAADCDGGFAVGRVVAGEAELLTLAVAPEARREGRGRRLLAAFEAEAMARGAVAVFLEVGEDNLAARGLYAAEGYASAGYRRDYYGPAGAKVGALVLKKPLG